MKYRLSADIGGTFTDFVLVDEEGNLTVAKTPSTPQSPQEAVIKGVELLAEQMGLAPERLLRDVTLIIHGTTVCDNTLIQLRFAKAGLICTKGFRDVLEHREGYRAERADYYIPLPPLLIPRRLRLGVEERVTVTGEEVTPLNEVDVRRAIEKLKGEGVESVAVSLMHSYANPSHEIRVGEILKEAFPEAYISISHEVLPVIGEYSRTSTTVVNACLGPFLKKYIERTEDLLRSNGYKGEVRYTQSNGGFALGETLKRKPVLAIHSGPSTAPAAGLFFSRILEQDNVVTIDMGGTSFDASLVERGTADIHRDFEIYRLRIGNPVININCIGAGGGSIAWIDLGGMLRVGPQSAEAIPGPACYMRGGQEPTVTDAHVVLGRFNPIALLGGRFKINSEASEKAINEKIAQPLNLNVKQAALGILKIVNSNMAGAIRAISVEKGRDPRDFILVAGGGCGAAHCAELANELNIPTVLIPRVASTFCAFGGLVSVIRHDYAISMPARLSEKECGRWNQGFKELEEEACRDLEAEGVPREEMRIERSLDMRYRAEVTELTVPIPRFEITKDKLPEIVEELHREHERVYTFRDVEREVEVMNVRVTASGPQPKIKVRKQPFIGNDPSKAKIGKRTVLFEGHTDYGETPIYDGTKIEVGNVIQGPAIVEEPTTTIVVIPGSRLELNKWDFYVMNFGS